MTLSLSEEQFNPEYLYIPVVIKCLVKEPSETYFFSGRASSTLEPIYFEVTL